jgi:hypothetical protein
MSKRRHKTTALPLMLAELTMASWETIARRSLLMAQGTCSRAEYARMVAEKTAAMQRSALVLSRSRAAMDMTALLAPWHGRATANARRLRRK